MNQAKISTNAKTLPAAGPPNKVKTIEKFVHPAYVVRATMGQIADFPDCSGEGLGVEATAVAGTVLRCRLSCRRGLTVVGYA